MATKYEVDKACGTNCKHGTHWNILEIIYFTFTSIYWEQTKYSLNTTFYSIQVLNKMAVSQFQRWDIIIFINNKI